MSLGIQKHSESSESDKKETTKENHPFGFWAWSRKEIEKENQPFGFWAWSRKETEKENQPFGFWAWSRKETEKENQPFGFWAWSRKETEKENQPFGFWAWSRKETEKENQPFGFWAWSRKETEKENQPFGFWAWSRKANRPFLRDTKKETQNFLALTSDEKEAHIINNYCRTPSAIGEDKHCALSLESMMDFAISKLGKNIKVMSSSLVQNQDKYVVEEVNKIGDKVVMCHRLNFKKVVFYCHAVNATTTYMVPFVASDGTKSKALTICHHDTRGMNPNVLSEVLNVKPGTVPVCHFIGNKAIAWVPDMSESGGHACVI
ncbi:embryonic abundant protein VF30.1-like [Vicia villosa]|uniref:embryonic abundant protein VF30.1-like n=1 Tax=Vicia villosa TaxID=3911 RepID=UPI00273B7D40|nr:embryonic abundant protein VF30.1-like [Vicia villosa]